MIKTILVTGGAGYIGSHTTLELKERGYRVVVLDNLSTGHRWAIRADEFIEGDIRDSALLTQTFERIPIDAIVHFAAKSVVSESIVNPLDYYDNNVVGAQHLIQAAIFAGTSKFIFSSTAAVYGAPNSEVIREDMDKSPINPYGRSKRMVELMLADAFKANQLSSVSFRYFNAAGARPDAGLGEIHQPETHLIPNILLSCLKGKEATLLKVFGDNYPTRDGSCIRDYIHVKDLARAHADAIAFLDEHPDAHTINLGTGKGYSVVDIIRACEAVIGHKIDYDIADRRAGDPPVLVADASKALSTLGWSPRHALPAMVEDAHKFLAEFDHTVGA
tara:strand:+ start:741 stop:1736 length:996 start_codon:yes stop_codon:yes gene_type:complete